MTKTVKAKKYSFDISVDYNEDIEATCVCGAKFKTGSTIKDVRVDICASCHPFFTGENKLVDSEGRIEKFKKKYEKFNK